MHGVHVPKEHQLGISFGRTPFEELVGKTAPVKDFCHQNRAATSFVAWTMSKLNFNFTWAVCIFTWTECFQGISESDK